MKPTDKDVVLARAMTLGLSACVLVMAVMLFKATARTGECVDLLQQAMPLVKRADAEVKSCQHHIERLQQHCDRGVLP